MKNLIYSFVFAAIAVFMSAMSAKAQEGRFTENDLELMVKAMNSQIGSDMLYPNLFSEFRKGGDAARKAFKENNYKSKELSGRFTIVARGTKIGNVDFEAAKRTIDTTMTVVYADDNNPLYLFAYDKIKQKFLFITKYEDVRASVAQAQQVPVVPIPQPSAQFVPQQQLTPAQQMFADQVAYAMKGGVILDKSVDQYGHGVMTVKDSLGRITTFDLTDATVLYSSNPILAPSTSVSGPVVSQPGAVAPQGTTAQAQPSGKQKASKTTTVEIEGDQALLAQNGGATQQSGFIAGPTPEEERLGYLERNFPGGLKKFDKDHTADKWVMREDVVAEELITPDLRRNQPVYIRDAKGRLVRDLDERARQARLVDAKYNLATGAPTRASEIQEANRGITIVNSGFGFQGGWNNGYSTPPQGQVISGGFQASVGQGNCNYPYHP